MKVKPRSILQHKGIYIIPFSHSFRKSISSFLNFSEKLQFHQPRPSTSNTGQPSKHNTASVCHPFASITSSRSHSKHHAVTFASHRWQYCARTSENYRGKCSKIAHESAKHKFFVLTTARHGVNNVTALKKNEDPLTVNLIRLLIAAYQYS